MAIWVTAPDPVIAPDPAASPADLDDAREAVKLIQTRGFNREQDVAADLEQLIVDSRPAPTC